MTTSTRDCISRSSIPWLSLIVCPVSFGWPLVGYESFRLIIFCSYVLIFLPCSDSVGETFRSVGGLGPPTEYFQWGTNIASLLTFVSGGGTSDIRPARVHYLLALWGLKEPARHLTPVQSIWTTLTTSHSLASRAREANE